MDLISLGLNSNFNVLVPKTPETNYVDQFRPIAFNNGLFKIITNLIENWVTKHEPNSF